MALTLTTPTDKHTLLTEFSEWLDANNLKRTDGCGAGMTYDPVTEQPFFDKRSATQLATDFLVQHHGLTPVA